MQPTFNEIIDKIDLKDILSKKIGHFLQPGIYKISNLNKMLEDSIPNNVKEIITIHDVRF